MSQMTYHRVAKYEEAPRIANCVTAVRYVLERYSNRILPPVWIGDMPRTCTSIMGGQLLRVSLHALRAGDLLFLRRLPRNKIDNNTRYISHIMVATGPGAVFHCGEKRGRPTIESLVSPIDAFAHKLIARIIDEPVLALSYIDPRNSKLRERFGQACMPIPIQRAILLTPHRVRRIIQQYLG